MVAACRSGSTEPGESGVRWNADQTATDTHRGVDLVISYDASGRRFNGTVTNTTGATVTDVRDAAQAFRLAVENEEIEHEVFLINGADTCSLEETPALAARHYADVPLRRPLSGFDSFVSTAKARRLLGYEPRYSWRQSEFRAWMEEQS